MSPPRRNFRATKSCDSKLCPLAYCPLVHGWDCLNKFFELSMSESVRQCCSRIPSSFLFPKKHRLLQLTWLGQVIPDLCHGGDGWDSTISMSPSYSKIQTFVRSQDSSVGTNFMDGSRVSEVHVAPWRVDGVNVLMCVNQIEELASRYCGIASMIPFK